MHTPVIATTDADVRVMVLRAFDAEGMTLRFHTDTRAPKAALIGSGAPVGVLFYDKEAGVQIRCRGTGQVTREGAAVDDAWAGSDTYARRCYLGAGPGELSDVPTSGLPDWIAGRRPTEEELITARPNFAILLVRLEEVDWFNLSHSGHRRALFRRDDGWRGRWIAP
jgi:pyridoxine/pyridoxamine 5'-phosphate oxidase